jgi:hypothetical protein
MLLLSIPGMRVSLGAATTSYMFTTTLPMQPASHHHTPLYIHLIVFFPHHRCFCYLTITRIFTITINSKSYY